ncbi:hypothetical protein Q765_06275 [Flavobacterium rivuli WB 3.3-2 = DSM 21788]|uniref:DUF2490 domain-containing protein n=1 Tax=Flavobacterium rivuli WB 3.3-2 = DSM 21788 TaxID=1121895 RepID=A0A0A2MG44_9FLAO|nr:DUF2490 domain-containing protein [Flavobacterium rivuli]KGO87270.1 hypothetical protein Q765_06275 [Flavobacterium rivuli WB 3.3-2 = DSM 21788]
MSALKFFITTIVLVLFISNCNAQLSPPGLGTTQSAFWGAVGVRQKLDAKNTSVTYVGIGRISDPEGDANPFKKQSIIVLNQEFYHKLNTHWQYSYALSYRSQNQYSSKEPYEAESPTTHQEFRGYGRLSYTAKIGSVKWKSTFREEIRKFYTPDFETVEDDFQLRSRFKTQATIPLDVYSESSLVGSAEALFSISNDDTEGWSDFEYKESRFCLYYSYSPDSIPVTFDIGYMNDLIGHGHHIKDANYLAFDIVLENVF